MRLLCVWALLGCLALPTFAADPPDLLAVLAEELDRNFRVLKEKADIPPYYLSYAVTEQESASISATLGSLMSQNERRSRALDVTMRVGTPKLDNYHNIRGEMAQFTSGIRVALDDSPNAIKQQLWRETDRVYRLAAQRLINIRTNKDVKVAEKEESDDFSVQEAATFREAPPPLNFDIGCVDRPACASSRRASTTIR